MIRAIFHRIAYVRVVGRRGFWRWLVDRIDYLYLDHLQPWGALRRGRRAMIHPSVSLRSAENIELGENTRVQVNCVLWASPGSRIRIGTDSGLGPGTMIFSSNHRFEPGKPYVKQPWVEKDVTIGRDVWVGAGSVIVAGVTIGDGSVIAAGSVVTRDVPPGVIAAGVPARVVRAREAETTASTRPVIEGASSPGAVEVDAEL